MRTAAARGGRAGPAGLDDLRGLRRRRRAGRGRAVGGDGGGRQLHDHGDQPGDVAGARKCCRRAGRIRTRRAGYHEETFTSQRRPMTGNDFGNWTTATKSGVKFEDLDADGSRGGGRAGPAGLDDLRGLRQRRRAGCGRAVRGDGGGRHLHDHGDQPGHLAGARKCGQAGWTQLVPGAGYHEETVQSRGGDRRATTSGTGRRPPRAA